MRITQTHKEATRAALVRAGLALFAEQGFAETTLEQITAAAGVAKATFYNYFKTKEDLALAGLADVLAQAQAELQKVLASPLPFCDRVVAFYRSFGIWSSAKPELIWVWCLENIQRGPEMGSWPLFHDMLVQIFAAGQQAGEVKPGRTPDDMAIDLAGITFAHLAAWYRSGAAGDLVERLCQAASAYLAGVCPEGPAPVPPTYS